MIFFRCFPAINNGRTKLAELEREEGSEKTTLSCHGIRRVSGIYILVGKGEKGNTRFVGFDEIRAARCGNWVVGWLHWNLEGLQIIHTAYNIKLRPVVVYRVEYEITVSFIVLFNDIT